MDSAAASVALPPKVAGFYSRVRHFFFSLSKIFLFTSIDKLSAPLSRGTLRSYDAAPLPVKRSVAVTFLETKR